MLTALHGIHSERRQLNAAANVTGDRINYIFLMQDACLKKTLHCIFKSYNFLVFQALSILTTYLTSSPISPLQQHFVELAQPLATDVDANIMLNSEAAVTVDFENVPIEKMLEIDSRFKSFIKSIVEKGSEALDVERIHTISKFRVGFLRFKLWLSLETDLWK